MSDAQREEKVWVDGLFVYEHNFPNGGSVLNCSVDAARLIAWLNQHRNEDGRVKFKIQKKLNPNKAGTHSAFLDTYQVARRPEAAPQPASGGGDDAGNPNGLPF
jgi:hypothetical protein